MVVIKVVAMFDDRAVLLRARESLMRAGLANADTMHTEPDYVSEESASDESELSSSPTGWERLQAYFDTEADHEVSAYAEGLRRGSALLVVETPTEKAERVKDVLRRSGAIDLRRRVHRWITTGWATFDPASPTFTDLEILDERRAIVSEADIAAEAALDGVLADNLDHTADRNISLFDEATGQSLGRLSEAELAVLQDSLEEERPGDDDYWINSEEIESIAGSPGATPHLVALLRRAVGANPDGVDIRFEREGESQSAQRSEAEGTGDEA